MTEHEGPTPPAGQDPHKTITDADLGELTQGAQGTKDGKGGKGDKEPQDTPTIVDGPPRQPGWAPPGGTPAPGETIVEGVPVTPPPTDDIQDTIPAPQPPENKTLELSSAQTITDADIPSGETLPFAPPDTRGAGGGSPAPGHQAPPSGPGASPGAPGSGTPGSGTPGSGSPEPENPWNVSPPGTPGAPVPAGAGTPATPAGPAGPGGPGGFDGAEGFGGTPGYGPIEDVPRPAAQPGPPPPPPAGGASAPGAATPGYGTPGYGAPGSSPAPSAGGASGHPGGAGPAFGPGTEGVPGSPAAGANPGSAAASGHPGFAAAGSNPGSGAASGNPGFAAGAESAAAGAAAGEALGMPGFASPGESSGTPGYASAGEHGATPGLGSPGGAGGAPGFASPGDSGGTPGFAAPGESGGTPGFAAPREGGGTPGFGSPGESGATPGFAAPGDGGGTPGFASPGESSGTPGFASPGEGRGTPGFAAPGEGGSTPGFAGAGDGSSTPGFGGPTTPPPGSYGNYGSYGQQPQAYGQQPFGPQPAQPYGGQQQYSQQPQPPFGTQPQPAQQQQQQQQPAFGPQPYPGYGQQQGTTPPPFGGPYLPGGGVPEGKKRNNALFFGSIAGGVVAVVVVVAVILAVTGVFASPDPKATAAKRLEEASKALGGFQAAKYHGTVTSGADSMVGDFKVISNGSTQGDVTWGGDQAQFVDVGGSVFVKSDANYWKTTADYTPIGSAATVDTTKWGRRRGDSISFNFQQLAPSAIAGTMHGKTKKDITTTITTNYAGTKALKISTGSYVYYLTADGKAKLLRVEDHGAIDYGLDVDTAGGSSAMSDLQTSINQLSDSFDTTAIVVPGAYSDVSFTPSSASLKQKITVTHPTGGGSQTPVTAIYAFFKDQAGTNKIDQCTATGTPSSDGSLQLSCSADDSSWTSFANGAANGAQIWYKYVSFTVGGATSDDIQTLLKGLTSPSTGGGGSSGGQSGSGGGGISG